MRAANPRRENCPPSGRDRPFYRWGGAGARPDRVLQAGRAGAGLQHTWRLLHDGAEARPNEEWVGRAFSHVESVLRDGPWAGSAGSPRLLRLTSYLPIRVKGTHLARSWARRPRWEASSGSPPRLCLAPGLTASCQPVAFHPNHSGPLLSLARSQTSSQSSTGSASSAT